MQPGERSRQPKEVPLETFFHEIVMIRNNLRVLEQKVNASAPPSPRLRRAPSKLSDVDNFDLQQHITPCYGSLTTFNILAQHPLSWNEATRVAPASCWPRPSDAGTSACSGVSSARVTLPCALRRRVIHPPLPGANLTALDLCEAKGHTSKTRSTSSEPAPRITGRIHIRKR